MGSSSKVGTEVEKVGQQFLFFNIFLIYFYDFFYIIHSRDIKNKPSTNHTSIKGIVQKNLFSKLNFNFASILALFQWNGYFPH